MKKLLNKLIDEFFKNTSDKASSLNYFRKSQESYLLWLIILNGHYDNNYVSIEVLINYVSPRFASRQTVKNLLNTAIESGFIIKIQNKKDRRKRFIRPSEKTLKDFEMWAEDYAIKL